MRHFLVWLAKITGWPIYFFMFRKKVYYENRKIQGRNIKKRAIIVSNHRSIKDFVLYLGVFPWRFIHCLVGEMVYQKNKLLNFILWSIGAVKVDRQIHDLTFMSKAESLLEKEKVLLVFPEGKLSLNGRVDKFYESYVLLALKTGSPIIPVYTDGNYSFKKGANVIIGEPIDLRDYVNSDNPTKEEITRLNKIVRTKIIYLGRLLEEKKGLKKPNIFRLLFWDLGRILFYFSNFRYRVKPIYKDKKDLKVKGKSIIISNHSSFSDVFIIVDTFWRRRLNILAAEIVFDNHPIRSFFLKGLGCIRIDRTKNDIDAIRQCQNALNRGGALLIFPEGRIIKDNTLSSFKQGAVLLAVQTKTDITPTYISPKKKKGRTIIYVGERIKVSEMFGDKLPSLEEIDLISNTLYDRINKMKEIDDGRKDGRNI